MGVSCTVFTPATSSTITFAENSNTPGRHLLNLVVMDPQYAIDRYHVFGANGNGVIRGGQEDRRIQLIARYIDTESNIKLLMEADKAAWAINSVNITDEAGQEFLGCNLVPGSFRELRRTTLAGPITQLTGGCFAECSYEFQQDNPSGA